MRKWKKYLVTMILVAAVAISGLQISKAPSSFGSFVITLGDKVSAADYTLIAGSDNYTVIQNALNALPSTGGTLQFLSTGTYPVTNGGSHTVISRAIDNVTIEGAGQGTLFTDNASTAIFSAGSQSGWAFRNFATDAGSITYASSSKYTLSNLLLGSSYMGLLTDGSNPTGRTASYVIAAYNAPTHVKSQSDITLAGQFTDVGAVINSAIGLGYTNIQLTQGDFWVVTPILYPLDGFILDGAGPTTTLTLADHTNSWMFNTSDNGNTAWRVVFQNMLLNGSGANQNAGGLIRINRGESCIIQNCWLEYGYAQNILLNDTNHTNVTGNNIAVSTGGDGIDVWTTSTFGGNINIENNDISQNAGNGISIGAGISNFEIVGNTIWSNQLDNIQVNGGACAGTITGNLIDFASLFGIELNNTAYMTVTGNTVMNSSQIGTNSYDHIHINDSFEFVVSGNTVFSSVAKAGRYGIFVGGATYIGTITGNTIWGCTANMEVQAWDRIRIKDNTGWNPKGLISNPIGTSWIGSDGSGTTVVSGTVYMVSGYDCFITSTGGTVSNIAIKDAGGNVMLTGVTTLTNQFVPIGYSVTWTHTGAPTVTVFGN